MHLMCILLYMFMPKIVHAALKSEDTTTKAIFKNERSFPNGSVIGTYNYKDENGNIVFVTYYADDSSYGVEFKSMRNIEDNSEQTNKQDNLSKIESTITTSNAFEPAISMNTTKYITSNEFYKNNSYNPYDVLNSYPKMINKDHHKTNDDYEIFLENVLKPSEKHNKERVRIYIDKYKRKTRKIPSRSKVPKH
ncbi:unnamed protein product [Euphydryas editha]|uniref:Uncharacterized protein n=1 Tax=Euphydryas editha TaxID=104508 RepID=A0AAU9VA50_EUPED|nr:unnamed protein product [Euphydryas editha]